ncbi:MAG: hypothetical protein Q9227_005887 [Pyrenula ochraceoflavens]
MSNIEQSLNVLLPTLNSDLPQELIDLSTSLLAQSHSRASTLKPEEEIARPYACAEIACKRLKNALNLPQLSGRPPCAPRVYKKFYAFLEQALPARTTRKSTGNGRGSKSDSKTSAKSKQASSTPLAKTTGPVKRKLFAGTAERNGGSLSPADLMPLIRKLCAAFDAKDLAPHLFTGVSVILAQTNALNAYKGEDRQVQLSCMTVALLFIILARARIGDLDDETFNHQSEKAVTIAELPQSAAKSDVDGWIEQIIEQGWTDGQEWWDNVPSNVTERDQAHNAQEEEDDIVRSIRKKKKSAMEDEERHLLPGLGTMLQEQNCWLSEEKRNNYAHWRSLVTVELERLEDPAK